MVNISFFSLYLKHFHQPGQPRGPVTPSIKQHLHLQSSQLHCLGNWKKTQTSLPVTKFQPARTPGPQLSSTSTYTPSSNFSSLYKPYKHCAKTQSRLLNKWHRERNINCKCEHWGVLQEHWTAFEHGHGETRHHW